MTDPDRHKLLHGPYRAPALRRGDRAACLLRDCDVVVTSWTAARIPWPRCRALGTHGGGSGLLVDEELARAVRHESAAAVMFWWGAAPTAVWRWRKALGVTCTNNEGSRRLVRAAAGLGGAAMHERGLTEEEADDRSERARRLNLGQYLVRGGGQPLWTPEQLALLGAIPDDEAAVRTGRSHNAVRLKRERLGVPNPVDRRRRGHRKGKPPAGAPAGRRITAGHG